MRSLLLVLLLLGAVSTASATPITPAAFGAYTVTEGFEGVVVGPNVGTSPFTNIVEPGIVSSYTFASGVTLVAPVPNPGTMANGVFVHDFSLPMGATNGWGANGNVSSAANVPQGTAYLGAFDNLTGATNPVSFTLDVGPGIVRVGAYVTGAAGATVRLDVYDASNVLLETRTVATVPVANWGSNFLGIERSERIRTVRFSGVDFGIDGLMIEVPEPRAAALLSLGLIVLALRRR